MRGRLRSHLRVRWLSSLGHRSKICFLLYRKHREYDVDLPGERSRSLECVREKPAWQQGESRRAHLREEVQFSLDLLVGELIHTP